MFVAASRKVIKTKCTVLQVVVPTLPVQNMSISLAWPLSIASHRTLGEMFQITAATAVMLYLGGGGVH